MKIAFLDRDGVVNVDKNYIYKVADFEFVDGIFELLLALKERGFLLVLITNQSGIGRGYYTEADFKILSDFMQDALREKLGFGFDKIYFCPHAPESNCSCRKPKIGMILNAVADFGCADLSDSILIGDKMSDIDCGKTAGVGKLFLVDSSSSAVESGFKKVKSLREIIVGL